jgi:hypothetical protein
MKPAKLTAMKRSYMWGDQAPRLEPPPDTLLPSSALLAKLGEIAIQAALMRESTDVIAASARLRAMVSDPEVMAWLTSMRDLGFLPIQ